jgi:hypothetical protein
MTHQNETATDSAKQPISFSITEPMLTSLRQTKPWARFLSILGFISISFMVIGGTINIFVLSGDNSQNSFLQVILLGTLNILMGLLYLFPSLFLFKFSSAIGRLLDGGGSREMEEALSNQKSFWKFIGILTIIMFCIAILGIVAAIIIPQFARIAGK